MDDTITTASPARSAPASHWLVALFALLWNSFGAYDYVMSRTRNADYFRKFLPDTDPAEVFAYMDSMPVVASLGWGLGVWGAVAGALLLLARSRHAVTAFALSLLGMAMSFPIQWTSDKMPKGMESHVMEVVVIVFGLLLFLYSRRALRRGVLR